MRIGVDLGGTKTEAIVMDDDGKVLFRERTPTPQKHGYDAVLDNIISLVSELETRCGESCRVGIGTPGAISSVTGFLKNSNTVCLNGRPVKQDLETRLNREVCIENDANCFALSEAIDGAGKEGQVVFGVIIGTGVGGGIVINKNLVSGPQHIAGEWGHNVLIEDGPLCYCGKRGCVETFLSGPGLTRAFELLGGKKGLDAKSILELAEQDNEIAEKALERYFNHFGKALSVVVNILDPDIIVLGGGLSHVAGLYTEGRRQLERYVFNDELSTLLVPNRHGDSAGVLGAARLCQ